MPCAPLDNVLRICGWMCAFNSIGPTRALFKILVDNFGDETTLPRLKLSIRKNAQEDFVDLYEALSNDSPLNDPLK